MKKAKFKKKPSLIKYLNKYYNYQDDIKLVYRSDTKASWRRVEYLGEKYDHNIPYNHRSVLNNEVVCEYDDEDKAFNLRCADYVCKRLREENLAYSKWDSGNKSTHVHIFIDVKQAQRLNILKSVFLRYYGTIYYDKQKDKLSHIKPDTTEFGRYKKITPDLQLCASNNLVRAEFGLNEKSGNFKQPSGFFKPHLTINEIPEEVWLWYSREVKRILSTKITKEVPAELSKSVGFKYIVNSHEFREADDGRERAMFMLMHTIRRNYTDKSEFLRFLIDWYRYSGGRKLTSVDIRHKVNYHWNRNYTITKRYLNDFLYNIGKEDLI